MVSHCRVVKTAIRAMGCQVNRHGYLAHRPSSTDHKHPRKRRTQHTIASLSDSLRFCDAVFSAQGSHERDRRVSSLVMVFELSLCGLVFSAVSSPNIRFAAGATVRLLSCGPTLSCRSGCLPYFVPRIHVVRSGRVSQFSSDLDSNTISTRLNDYPPFMCNRLLRQPPKITSTESPGTQYDESAALWTVAPRH